MEQAYENVAPSDRRIISRNGVRVGSHLNDGGIASIYHAFDGSGDQVVLRELHHRLKWKLRIRRQFKNGVAVRRALGDHPHIVKYLGEGGFLLPYEVIEYIPGTNLKQLIFRREPVVRLHPLCILQQIAEALSYVHSAGWLHLDVKPENVLVVYSAVRPQVKLTDFDLCQPIATTRAPRHFGGSLAYVPPEYLTDKQISISTDVFAFGVLAFNLFTGQMPFVGSVQSSMKRGGYDITFPVTQEGKTPDCVADFIRRCLEPEPLKRYCDDQELANGLKVLARKLSPEKGPHY